MVNSFGKVSEIKLTISNKQNKSYLENVYFTAPFKIAKPFPFKENGIKVLMMTASAGIMKGDTQNIEISVNEGSTAMITSQSYEKIHKMEDGFAKRDCNIEVSDNATLVYAPLPTIPFKGSSFITSNKINLKSKTSRLLFCEVLTCGRYMREEFFEFDIYKSYNSFYLDNKIIIRDNMVLDPKENDLSDFGFFEGKTHLGSIFCCNFGFSKDFLDAVRELIKEHALDGGATTLNDGSIAIRVLGSSAEHITKFFDVIVDKYI